MVMIGITFAYAQLWLAVVRARVVKTTRTLQLLRSVLRSLTLDPRSIFVVINNLGANRYPDNFEKL